MTTQIRAAWEMRSAPPEHGSVGCINPCQVFVRNLPTEFLEKDLESLAEEYGPIKRCELTIRYRGPCISNMYPYGPIKV